MNITKQQGIGMLVLVALAGIGALMLMRWSRARRESNASNDSKASRSSHLITGELGDTPIYVYPAQDPSAGATLVAVPDGADGIAKYVLTTKENAKYEFARDGAFIDPHPGQLGGLFLWDQTVEQGIVTNVRVRIGATPQTLITYQFSATNRPLLGPPSYRQIIWMA